MFFINVLHNFWIIYPNKKKTSVHIPVHAIVIHVVFVNNEIIFYPLAMFLTTIL